MLVGALPLSRHYASQVQSRYDELFYVVACELTRAGGLLNLCFLFFGVTAHGMVEDWANGSLSQEQWLGVCILHPRSSPRPQPMSACLANPKKIYVLSERTC